MDRASTGNTVEMIECPAFTVIGMKWEGTFAEAGTGGIRRMQAIFRERAGEIEGVVRPGDMLGLSYHAHPGGEGFTHYAAVEVEGKPAVPEGMFLIEVPAMTYARCEYRKGDSVDKTYQAVYAWIEAQGCAAALRGLTHLEIYPMHHDPFAGTPDFTILVPIHPR